MLTVSSHIYQLRGKKIITLLGIDFHYAFNIFERMFMKMCEIYDWQ